MSLDNSWRSYGFTLQSVIAEVYAVDPSHIDLTSSLDGSNRYDFDLILPQAEGEETIHRLSGVVSRSNFRFGWLWKPAIWTSLYSPRLRERERMNCHFNLAAGSRSSSTFFSTFNADFGNLTPEAMSKIAEDSEKAEEAHFQALASGTPSASLQAVGEISADGTIKGIL